MTSPHGAGNPDGTRTRFYLRRLHSLSGVVPVGVFLVEHLWTNSRALYGREAFNTAVGEIQALPGLAWIELFGIALPLLFHAGYGLAITARAKPNVGRYGYTRNWLYVLQRVSGLVALAFIGLHLWQYRIQKMLHTLAWENMYHQLQVDLGEPGMFALYFVGITAVVFHFANGLWLVGNTWGITTGAKGMKRSAWVCAAVGGLLWALGINTLLHFNGHCGGVIPMPEQNVQTLCRDANALQVPVTHPIHSPRG